MMKVTRHPISREELKKVTQATYGNLVKAVVDMRLKIMAVGGELHADEEVLLLEEGSKQEDLWGLTCIQTRQETILLNSIRSSIFVPRTVI